MTEIQPETVGIRMALLNAQDQFGPLLKTEKNPHFKSSYADLAGVIDTVTEALHANDIVVIQVPDMLDGEPILVTTLAHKSGETITGRYPLRTANNSDPQKLGAAMTYARRYSLMAVVGIAPEDDDGNYASGKTEAPVASSRGGGSSNSMYKSSPNKPPSPAQKNLISALAEQKVNAKTPGDLAKFVKKQVNKSLSDLSSADASTLIEALKAMPDADAGKDEPGY
jgi:hypothetical protein